MEAKKRVRVSVAATADVKPLGRFLRRAWGEAGESAWGWTGATEEAMKELSSASFLRKLVSRPGVRLFLAKEGDRIRGFAANRGIDSDTVELAGVIVEERYTGGGVGTLLVEAALGSAVRRGYCSMVVKTETFNKRAIGFYESRGFARIGSATESVEGKKVRVAVLERSLAASGIRGSVRQSGLGTR